MATREQKDNQRKYMSLQEFVDGGFLQEANRVFFHPLGLALSVYKSEQGLVTGWGPILDDRDDKEGIAFFDVSQQMVDRSQKIAEQWNLRKIVRTDALGFMVQPLTVGEMMFTPKPSTQTVTPSESGE